MMGRPGWMAEIKVDADLHKVPSDPIEAAKYAMDEVHRLASPFVSVEYHDAADGTTETWLVDTSDGRVTRIGKTTWDPEREDVEPDPGSACEWADGDHYAGTFRIVDQEYGTDTISCGNHLADSISGAGIVMVFPYEQNGD